ncbi:pantothenate kinase, partial [mine drainage metagenome]
MTENLPSPFLEVERDEWKKLREREKINITEEELLEIRGINENLSIKEVEEIYAPISKLLRIYYDNYGRLISRRADFFRETHGKVPYIIGIAGSVAVGKSTTARILKALISGWPSKPRVYIVTTDGFLLTNRELESRNLMERKGFPESYDLRRMIKFLYDLKSGLRNLKAPIYSHLVYDIVPDQFLEIDEPDIIIFEGLN